MSALEKVLSPPSARSPKDGARREVPWELPDEPTLDEARRKVLGASWRARTIQEHLAVGAFSLMATELAATGADAVVLALVTRASSDEVRHTEVCRRLAVRHLGEGTLGTRFRGLPNAPPHARRPLEERALLHLTEMSCFNETFTTVYLTEMLERARQPTARAAVESLLEDEIDHGRVGWAHLAATLRDGGGEALSAALPDLMTRSLAPVLDARRPDEPDDPTLEAHGYLGWNTARELYVSTLRDVILPGFDALGVDTRAARSLARQRNWLG